MNHGEQPKEPTEEEKKIMDMENAGLQYKEGKGQLEEINILEIIKAGDDLSLELDPGAKIKIGNFEIDTTTTKLTIGNKLPGEKYLNLINGRLTVCDFEGVKYIIDDYIEKTPGAKEEFLKNIETLNEANPEKLPEMYQYIKEKYGKDNIEKQKLNQFGENEDKDEGIPEAVRQEVMKDFNDFLEGPMIKEALSVEEKKKRTDKLLDDTRVLKETDSIEMSLARNIKEAREEAEKIRNKQNEDKLEEVRKRIQQI